MWLILFPLIYCRRPGSNQTHIPLQDIDKLRKLIQARLPDKLPNPRLTCSIWQHLIPNDSRIKVHLEHQPVTDLILIHKLFLSLLSIHIHASELIHLELSSIPSNPLLRKEDRPRRIDINNRTNYDRDQQCNETSHKSPCDIHQPFHKQLGGICIVHTCTDHCIASNLLNLLAP